MAVGERIPWNTAPLSQKVAVVVGAVAGEARRRSSGLADGLRALAGSSEAAA